MMVRPVQTTCSSRCYKTHCSNDYCSRLMVAADQKRNPRTAGFFLQSNYPGHVCGTGLDQLCGCAVHAALLIIALIDFDLFRYASS
jgi:hypothetical protein